LLLSLGESHWQKVMQCNAAFLHLNRVSYPCTAPHQGKCLWGSRDQYGSYPSSFWHYPSNPTWLVRGALVQADRPQPLLGCPLTCFSSAASVDGISSSLFVFANIFFLALQMSVRVVVMSNHNDRLFDCVENIWRRYTAGCWWQLPQCTSARSRICQRGDHSECATRAYKVDIRVETPAGNRGSTPPEAQKLTIWVTARLHIQALSQPWPAPLLLDSRGGRTVCACLDSLLHQWAMARHPNPTLPRPRLSVSHAQQNSTQCHSSQPVRVWKTEWPCLLWSKAIGDFVGYQVLQMLSNSR